MDKLWVIGGPTASGKTALSVLLAKQADGVIISADSMQVYRGMDIGTAKPDMEERGGIPHELLDVLDPWEDCSVVRYQKLAFGAIDRALQNNKQPILVGGTGLYIDAVAQNTVFSEISSDLQKREELTAFAKVHGNRALWERLREIDPASAQRLHENDLRRIVRAIEVYETTGETISVHQERSHALSPKYDVRMVGLSWERETLYRRIDRRVDEMMEKGLLDEVKKLREAGIDKDTTAMQGIGYKEISEALDGKMTLPEAVELIKQGSRRYAKRQLTWFRRTPNLHWIEMEGKTLQDAAEECLKIFRQNA